MGRERRDFVRRAGWRDATLFVIASEGAKTEPEYFTGLKEKWQTSRVHVEILTRKDRSLSSPDEVLKSLEEFSAQFQLREGDQLWLVIDRDSQTWKARTMSAVAKRCRQKGYFLAVSNPCFELWLLLHFEDVPSQAEDRLNALLKNANGFLKKKVASHMSSKKKHIDHFIPRVETAIQRSRLLDRKPGERWPSQLGTHVYRLVEQLRPQPV
jgi:RloB-like protein